MSNNNNVGARYRRRKNQPNNAPTAAAMMGMNGAKINPNSTAPTADHNPHRIGTINMRKKQATARMLAITLPNEYANRISKFAILLSTWVPDRSIKRFAPRSRLPYASFATAITVRSGSSRNCRSSLKYTRNHGLVDSASRGSKLPQSSVLPASPLIAAPGVTDITALPAPPKSAIHHRRRQ